MTMHSTVFIVEDDAAVRSALAAALQQQGLRVQAHASAETFLRHYDPSRRGCLVLDISMPGMNGIELQEELAARHIPLPVLFITGYGEIADTVRAIKAGAVDFLEKPVAPEELLPRIQDALELDVRRDREARQQQALRQRFAQLTKREREVILRVIAGESNKEIAKNLEISFRTVEKYRASAMIKLDVTSVAELCRSVRVPFPDAP